jgi:hypothetical protein
MAISPARQSNRAGLHQGVGGARVNRSGSTVLKRVYQGRQWLWMASMTNCILAAVKLSRLRAFALGHAAGTAYVNFMLGDADRVKSAYGGNTQPLNVDR